MGTPQLENLRANCPTMNTHSQRHSWLIFGSCCGSGSRSNTTSFFLRCPSYGMSIGGVLRADDGVRRPPRCGVRPSMAAAKKRGQRFGIVALSRITPTDLLQSRNYLLVGRNRLLLRAVVLAASTHTGPASVVNVSLSEKNPPSPMDFDVKNQEKNASSWRW